MAPWYEPYFYIVPSALLVLYIVVELFFRLRFTVSVLRSFLLLPVLFDLFLQWLSHKLRPPRYRLEGSCHMCGKCCEYVIGDPPELIKRSHFLLTLYASYHAWLHNFEAVGKGPRNELVFRCHWLGPDHLCRHYALRPHVCRNYPYLPAFEKPAIIDGCGFRAVKRPTHVR